MLPLRPLLFSCLLLFTLPFQRPASAQKYTLTDLGSLSDGTLGFESSISSVGTAINDKGWVAGYAAAPHGHGVTHAFLWANGVMRDLGALASNGSAQGVAINNHGVVVGTERSFRISYVKPVLRPLRYSEGELTDLNPAPDLPDAYANAVNASGDIVGSAGDFSKSIRRPSTGYGRGYVWHKGETTILGTLPGATDSSANSINKWGQVTGGSGNHVFLYDKGKMTDIGSLPACESSGRAINDKGEIVGVATSFTTDSKGGPDLASHVVLYRDHILTDLMAPLGADWAITSVSINNSSQIICTAYSDLASDTGRGCLYSSGKWINLNNLVEQKFGWTVTQANGINDEGQIVGSAIYLGPGKLNGVTHAVLLTPVK